MKIDINSEIKRVEKMQSVLELLIDAKRRNNVIRENISNYKKMGFWDELVRRSERDLVINEMAIRRIESFYLKLRSSAVGADVLLDALKNLENDDNSIPVHAWNIVQNAIETFTEKN